MSSSSQPRPIKLLPSFIQYLQYLNENPQQPLDDLSEFTEGVISDLSLIQSIKELRTLANSSPSYAEQAIVGYSVAALLAEIDTSTPHDTTEQINQSFDQLLSGLEKLSANQRAILQGIIDDLCDGLKKPYILRIQTPDHLFQPSESIMPSSPTITGTSSTESIPPLTDIPVTIPSDSNSNPQTPSNESANSDCRNCKGRCIFIFRIEPSSDDSGIPFYRAEHIETCSETFREQAPFSQRFKDVLTTHHPKLLDFNPQYLRPIQDSATNSPTTPYPPSTSPSSPSYSPTFHQLPSDSDDNWIPLSTTTTPRSPSPHAL